MPRQSLVHYIAPSAISLIPNCNGSANDIAVYLSRETKIKVNSDNAGIGIDAVTGSYQEWTLSGRNRRLADSSTPYTIYARLNKTDKTDGYLVFVKQQLDGMVWKDKYPYVIKDGDGLYRDVYGTESQDYWYVRLGDVSLPVSGKREVTLDTGILGTDQYNEEWNLNPDSLPLRIDLSATVDDEDAGPTPYVYWGQSLQLVASLIKGWSEIESPQLDHWEIARNSGDATADAAWPGSERAELFAQSGSILLAHPRSGTDDFNGAVNATFTITAWGYPESDSSGTPPLVKLATATICIMAETIETFDLAMSSEVMNFSPQTDTYKPADGINVFIRATDQRGNVFNLNVGQYSSMGLSLSYARVGTDQWTPITVSGQAGDEATGNVPASAFTAQESVNVRLTRAESDGGGGSVDKELARKTIAFVSDGEDSKYREWIYRLDVTTGYDSKTGTIGGDSTKPVSGKTGDDWNADLTDNFVPTGWSDHAVVISEKHPIAYTSSRDYDYAADKWGDFSQPVPWSKWGDKGTDGDGVQYLYKLFDHELTDAERTENIPATPTFNPSTKKWEAEGWSDNPLAPTDSLRFCYCSVIQHTDGSWGTFQKLGLWSRYSEDGKNAISCFLDRIAVFVPTDTSGRVLAAYETYVTLKAYAGHERLNISAIQIDEGESASYASLGGSTLMNADGDNASVDDHKLSLVGASVTGTKVILGEGWSAGLSSIKITVPEGELLDEHVIELTITGTDHNGEEYTAYASIEVQKNTIAKDGKDGKDGKDAASLIISPSVITYPANPDGTAVAAYSTVLAVPRILINGTAYDCTAFTVDTSTVSGVAYDSATRTVSVAASASPNGTLIAIGTYSSDGETWIATVAITIAPERRRAIVRGPRVWQTGMDFQSGKIGESYLDITVYNGEYWQCLTTHRSTALIYPTEGVYWTKATEFGFIASGLILAEQSLIRNLIVEELKSLKSEAAAGQLDFGTYSYMGKSGEFSAFELGTYDTSVDQTSHEEVVNYSPRYRVTFQIKNGKKLPVISFYDENGNKVGDLDESIFGNMESVSDTWGTMNLIYYGDIMPTNDVYNIYATRTGTAFYQYLEGYYKNPYTGEYTYIAGKRTGISTYDQSAHNGSNGRWQKSVDISVFKEGDSGPAVGADGVGMRTGYYIKAGTYIEFRTLIHGRRQKRSVMDVYRCTCDSPYGDDYYYSGVLTKVSIICTEWKDVGDQPIEPIEDTSQDTIIP